MSKKKIEVKEWIEAGEFDESERTEDGIIAACNALDEANTPEILGCVLFKATNGKYYTVVVEALIVEAHKDFVKDVLAEKAQEAADATDGLVPVKPERLEP